MSSLPLTAPIAATGLPTLGEANAPASVRNGDAAVKHAYAAAQGFEEMLLQQLSQSLTQSSGLSGENEASGESSGAEGSLEGGGDAGGGMLASLLPQTLTEGVMREGGLGLAAQLTRALDPTVSTAVPGSTVAPASTAASAPTSTDSAGGVSAPAGTAAAPVPTVARNAAGAHTGGASA